MAAVVPNLIEDAPSKQVGAGHLLAVGQSVLGRPFVLMPRAQFPRWASPTNSSTFLVPGNSIASPSSTSWYFSRNRFASSFCGSSVHASHSLSIVIPSKTSFSDRKPDTWSSCSWVMTTRCKCPPVASRMFSATSVIVHLSSDPFFIPQSISI